MKLAPMHVHVDVLGWLHALWGLLGLFAGTSLALIAAGAFASPRGSAAGGPFYSTLALLLAAGLALAAAGVAFLIVGRALRGRRRRGRTAALLLAAPNLLLPPYGTALAVYACWVLLNDDARRMFGRPPRSTAPA